jgi:mannose-6-phosphate isomerase-like protein (cupin superfamily)
METGVSYAAIDPSAEERFVSLRRLLGVSTFGLNQILLRPGERGRVHRHARQEEVYLVLEGKLTLFIEGDEHTLGPGELARVAPDVRRAIANIHPENCLLIALGGAEPHNGRDAEAFTGWDATEPSSPQEVPMPENLPVTGS